MKSSTSFQIFTTVLAQLSAILFKVAGDKIGPPPPEPSAEEIKSALIKHEVFKDLGITHYPSHILQVRYGNHYVQLGNRIPENLPIKAPDAVNFSHPDLDTWYTLLMIGPDNPTREKPLRRSYEHWLIGNIAESNFTEGELLVPYDWSTAPYKKGIHRVVFLLYKQSEEESMVFDERFHMRVNITIPRDYFNTTFLSNKYHLGEPVAVNFFETELTEDSKHQGYWEKVDW